jgi:phage terminase small subunit
MEGKPLSRKHQKFVNEYLKRWNGTRAYMAVYPKAQEDSARANASELLTKPNIAAAIAERIRESQMSADEALDILAAQARGDIGNYIEDNLMIDLSAARENGGTKIIKKIRQRTITKIGKGATDDDTEITDTEIELYDAQAAAEKILKIHGKFVDRHDITNSGELTIRIVKASDDTGTDNDK